MRQELSDFSIDDLLSIARAQSGLNHGRRVDIDLDFRPVLGQDVALKVWRDVYDEGIFASIHQTARRRFGKSRPAA